MCDRFPRKFDVQISHKPSNYVLGLIFVVNIKFPQATYHTIVPSTEELCCLNTRLNYTLPPLWIKIGLIQLWAIRTIGTIFVRRILLLQLGQLGAQWCSG